jgi:hypothetical protein
MMHRSTAKLIVILGSVLLAAAVGTLIFSALPFVEPPTVTIPGGAGVSPALSWGAVAGGTISGGFHVEDGSQVMMVVLNQLEYAAVTSGTEAAQHNVYNVTAADAQFVVGLTGHDNFHLLFYRTNQSSGALPEIIDINVTVTRIDPYYFGAGVVLLIVGIPAVIIGFRRVREGKPAPAPTWRT